MFDSLTGARVVITRPEGQSETLSRRLRSLGAIPVLFPVIAIAPPEVGGALDRALAHLADYDWIIFTSVNGVVHFWERLAARAETPVDRLRDIPGFRGRVAAIGPATAAALELRGVTVQTMPSEYRAEAILAAIGDVAGLYVLLPRADIARADLADGLRQDGAFVIEAAAYRTVPATPPAAAFEELRRGVDIVTFTSASTVRNFVALTRDIAYGSPLTACIGPVTADAARELGLRVDAVAEVYTMDGLIEALQRLWIDHTRPN
jgi:uroporphyrinogen-III synthase